MCEVNSIQGGIIQFACKSPCKLLCGEWTEGAGTIENQENLLEVS